MRTDIEIDDALMAEALETGGLRTKRETVAAALKLFVQARKRETGYDRAQVEMLRFKGRIPFLHDDRDSTVKEATSGHARRLAARICCRFDPSEPIPIPKARP